MHAVLSFLVSSLRGCVLCLCSVKIYENSKLPKRSIYDIPLQTYCNEVSLGYNTLLLQHDNIVLNLLVVCNSQYTSIFYDIILNETD